MTTVEIVFTIIILAILIGVFICMSADQWIKSDNQKEIDKNTIIEVENFWELY